MKILKLWVIVVSLAVLAVAAFVTVRAVRRRQWCKHELARLDRLQEAINQRGLFQDKSANSPVMLPEADVFAGRYEGWESSWGRDYRQMELRADGTGPVVDYAPSVTTNTFVRPVKGWLFHEGILHIYLDDPITSHSESEQVHKSPSASKCHALFMRDYGHHGANFGYFLVRSDSLNHAREVTEIPLRAFREEVPKPPRRDK